MGYRIIETILTEPPLEAGTVQPHLSSGNDLSGSPQGAGGVGGLLAASDAASGRSWCYAYDGNGNVSAVVDLADGTRVGRYEYDAFGRTIAQWGDEALAAVNEYRFSTKPLEGTGLYYYGFRYYMPETGRWASRDPIGERGGGMNLYGFVGNAGINPTDILGLDFIADGHQMVLTRVIGYHYSIVRFRGCPPDNTNRIHRNETISSRGATRD